MALDAQVGNMSNANTDVPTGRITALIYDFLYQLDDTLTPQPMLASDLCDVSEDETVWTCSLVDNAFFHNGDPITVDDVVYSYQLAVSENCTYNPSVCSCSMSASAGGLAIRNGASNTGTIIDAVGWGGASNIFFEGTRTTAPPLNTSQARVLNGCQDTDNNAVDFANLNPSASRNRASALVVCDGGGTTLFAAIAANPTSVVPGSNTLLTVTVIPATTPPSTGISVTGNLSQIGGSASQTFFDDGTNGDAAPGDNVFSYLAQIPLETAGGNHLVTAVAADAQARSVSLQQNINVTTPLPNEDPLLFGNPSGATGDVANENNYLMIKPQYTLSYNRSKATPNWVAWRLDASWIGSTPRQDDYRPDTSLPAGWYQVLDPEPAPHRPDDG
jgi:hypothetical protein